MKDSDSVTIEVPLCELDCLIYDSYDTDKCIVTITLEQIKQLLNSSFEDGMKAGVSDYLQEQKWEKQRNEKTKENSKKPK